MPAVLVAATCVTFRPALRGEFLLWDDYFNLVNNQAFRGLGSEQLHWMFTTFHGDIYEPFSWLAKGIQYQLWQMEETGYHAFSLALHVVSVLCVYFISRRLLRGRVPENPSLALGAPKGVHSGSSEGGHETSAVLGAGIAALLFGLHPLRVECAALISAQPHVQAGTFALLAVRAYLHRMDLNAERSRRRYPFLALVLLAASLLSKAMALGLPIVFLVLDALVLGRWRRGERSRVLLEKLPFLVLAGAAAWVARVARAGQIDTAALEAFGLWDRIAQSCYCICFHLRKMLWPTDLVPIYVDLTKFNAGSPSFILPVVLVVLLTGVCVVLRRRVPGLLAAWLCYLVLLGPFTGFFNRPHFPVDRYTYLPMVGLMTLVGAGVSWVWRTGKRAERVGPQAVFVIAGLSAVCIMLGILSHRQTRVFRGSVALFEHIVPRVKGSEVHAHMVSQLALALYHERRHDEAVARFRKALEEDPSLFEAWVTMGIVLMEQGRWPEAVLAGRRAIEIDPESRTAHFNLAASLAAMGEHEAAVSHYAQAIRIDPAWVKAHQKLASTWVDLGRYDRAVDALRVGISQTAGDAVLEGRLAWLLATSPDAAIRDASEALRLAVKVNERTGGSDPQALDTLAAAYANAGRFETASQIAGRARLVASQAGFDELAAGIGARLQMYEQRRPYRVAPN